MSSVSTTVGEMSAVIAITMEPLNMFEPMILPRARSKSDFLTAVMVAASSGSEVPMATIVRPMIRSLMPKALAISEALQTIARELPSSNIKPSSIRILEVPRENF